MSESTIVVHPPPTLWPRPCPLTPALIQILQTCLEERTTESKRLAQILNRSHHTVRNQFHQILCTLQVGSRAAAVMVAMDEGWIGRIQA